MDAPKKCLYCDGTDENCGFCEMGKPLDTQEDWDRSWGGIFEKFGVQTEKTEEDNGPAST